MTRLFSLLAVAAVVAAATPALAEQEASQLDTSEAAAFMGDWTLNFDSQQGPFVYSLNVADVGGKVGATLSNDMLGNSTVTDISKNGGDLNMKWQASIQGNATDMSLMLTPDGDGLKAALDVGDLAHLDGTGAR